MTIRYAVLTWAEARELNPPGTLDAEMAAYQLVVGGVFALRDGRPVTLVVAVDVQALDRETLGETLRRNWGWAADALNGARTSGVNAGLQQTNDGHVDTLNAILRDAPEGWDGEESADDIAVRYVAHLVAEVRRLGGRLHPGSGEDEPEAPAAELRPARVALAAALDDAHGERGQGDPQAPGDELVERLLGSEAGRRALVDVAAEIGLEPLAEALIRIAGSVQEVFESAVGVLRYGAGSEHPAGPNPPPAAEDAGAAVYLVSFESVPAIQHPELYQGHRDRVTPGTDVSAIPDDWWTRTETPPRTLEEARRQYDGLLSLAAEGEPIRAVRLWRSKAPAWDQVTP